MKPELKKVADELLKHLKAAHSLIENTEAFGRTASHGILQCGDSVWNIDDSKAAIAAYEAQPAELVNPDEEYKPEYKYCEDGKVVWTNAADAPVVKSAEPVKVSSFDDWFKERNSGLSFDEAHMGDGALIDKSMKELSRQMRDYVTEMVNEKVR